MGLQGQPKQPVVAGTARTIAQTVNQPPTDAHPFVSYHALPLTHPCVRYELVYEADGLTPHAPVVAPAVSAATHHPVAHKRKQVWLCVWEWPGRVVCIGWLSAFHCLKLSLWVCSIRHCHSDFVLTYKFHSVPLVCSPWHTGWLHVAQCSTAGRQQPHQPAAAAAHQPQHHHSQQQAPAQ